MEKDKNKIAETFNNYSNKSIEKLSLNIEQQ